MRVVVVDARDSFVHIIAEYLEKAGATTAVVRPDLQDTRAVVEALGAQALVLGPGPGHPADSCHMPLLDTYLGRLPILGVCLGHQALGLHLGWSVTRAPLPRHGKRSLVHHDGSGLYAGVPSPVEVARYHSLVVVPRDSGLSSARVTARTADDQTVMSLEDNALLAWGVQFHPESYGTSDGLRLIQNFCAMAGLPQPAA